LETRAPRASPADSARLTLGLHYFFNAAIQSALGYSIHYGYEPVLGYSQVFKRYMGSPGLKKVYKTCPSSLFLKNYF
jgi:hypothetical protein